MIPRHWRIESLEVPFMFHILLHRQFFSSTNAHNFWFLLTRRDMLESSSPHICNQYSRLAQLHVGLSWLFNPQQLRVSDGMLFTRHKQMSCPARTEEVYCWRKLRNFVWRFSLAIYYHLECLATQFYDGWIIILSEGIAQVLGRLVSHGYWRTVTCDLI